ncbi:MAG: hypothetical protein HQL54_12220 [Magnetococcales bacterium]|nr:hypothetical protein [Magnetococcales bacterium]
MKQLICMKWGEKFPADYVNRLYGMVSRNITGPFRFVCMTDRPEGVRSEVECKPCPTVSIPEPHCNRGWRKVSLWAETLPEMTGDWLFLDLDVVITGTLDGFFTHAPEKNYLVMQNWTQPGKGIGNTSVFRFRIGSHPYLLDKLLNQTDDVFGQFTNSQTYISKTVKEIDFWPDEWCILFKTHCVPLWPMRYWQTPILPETARVVAFPGVPNPHEAVQGRWPAPWYKRPRKFIRPAVWIESYWRG